MPAKLHKRRAAADTRELFPVEAFVGAELERMKSAPEDERGAIFTRAEIADFMLDLIGYTPDMPLWKYRLLEPSFGGGDFLLKAIKRLLASADRENVPLEVLGAALRAVELHQNSFADTRNQVRLLLMTAGFSASDTSSLIDCWLIHADLLLEPLTEEFDFVVGNPPYVRQELIPAAILAEYRQRYDTLYDRADLYVPFMERSLKLLKPKGLMCFICSDRWMKNRYGGPLRRLIAEDFSLRCYVDMVGTDAFQSEVVAYPAITVIQRGNFAGNARIAHRPQITAAALAGLCKALKSKPAGFGGIVTEALMKPTGDEPWLLESDAQPSLDLVRRLEKTFPLLEEAGCQVGIGVATGADKVFIGPFDELDVEDERKLPLATTRDILTGTLQWRGLGVVNPFEDDGRLADFAHYPRFAAYIRRHREVLSKRHCAQRANGSWYRTIDRITPSLTHRPKLLIPDIKGEASIVLDKGSLYPHHNLYFITSTEWPLIALQRVLLAGIARLFVRAYSTKMRGGCLRFQAQYLRRIRLPRWEDTPQEARRVLASPGPAAHAAIQQAVMQAFGLHEGEQAFLSD